MPALGPAVAIDRMTQSESLQARLLDAVLSLLQRLSAISPVVLVVEDLHWADPATRETVAFLVRHIRSDRILLVMTFRADELHRRHPLLPWLAELDRSGRVERIDLERLDPADTRELLEAILGAPPSGDLTDRIHRRSDGNPFFIEELLMAGVDGAGGPLPPTLREVLLARISAMPDRAQTVIGVAAVAGRRVDHGLLAKVAGMDEHDLLDALRTAVASQVLVTSTNDDGLDGDYAFRHALLQEAAYDDLLPGERIAHHLAFARALAERGPGSGAIAAGHWAELAYHWSAARDDRQAFDASIRAGDAAARAFAFADARRHDERALELWTRVEGPEDLAGFDRVELLDRAALAAWLAGDSRRSVALRREAIAALGPDADPIRVGTMLERLGRALWVNAETEAALEAHEAAVRIMPVEPPTAELARVLSGYGQILMLLDRWSESTVLCKRAVDIARDVGARQVEGHALNTYGLDLAVGGRCEEGFAELEASLAIAREVANADDIGRAYNNLGEARRVCGDVRGALEVTRAGVAAAEEIGLSRTYGTFIGANGVSYGFDLGLWEEADRTAETYVATHQMSRPQRRYGLTRWLPLLVAEGDDRVEASLDELRMLLEGVPVEAQFHSPYRLSIAESALWRGEPDKALASIRQGLDEIRRSEWPRYHLRLYRVGMRAVADMAEVERARRNPDGERQAVEAGTDLWGSLQLIPGVADGDGGEIVSETAAEVATVEAERARLERRPAVELWRAAADRWRVRENPYLVAYCRWREAEALLGDGDRAGAGIAAREAHAIAEGLGATPLRESIEALAARSRLDLAEAGAADPAPAAVEPDGNPFGLTRRERDVLPLLVRGRTNRQIADELFISENTAGVHVSNILGKMGASTRTEAAGIAARLGLGIDP